MEGSAKRVKLEQVKAEDGVGDAATLQALHAQIASMEAAIAQLEENEQAAATQAMPTE